MQNQTTVYVLMYYTLILLFGYFILRVKVVGFPKIWIEGSCETP
jgi:hypothetical protein